MGMKIKSSFSSIDDILNSIKSQVEETPEIFTSQNEGKEILVNCPVCNDKKVAVIIEDGKCRCNDCNTEFKLNLDVNFTK